MTSQQRLRQLECEIGACELCPRLKLWREGISVTKRRAYRDEPYWGKPVPGFGDPAARLLIVGLAPGAHGANRTGRVFTGDSSGDFLYSVLHHAGFASQPESTHRGDGMKLNSAWMSCAARCAPPDNRPTPVELATCRPYLERELALLKDIRVVVALGQIAFEQVLTALPPAASDLRARPKFGHGAAYRLVSSQWLLASYHPSRQNTNTGRLTPRMMLDVFLHARALCQSDGGHVPAPAR